MKNINNVDLSLNTNPEEETKMIKIYGVEFEKGQLEEWMSGLTEIELTKLANQDLVPELVPLAEKELAELERIEEEMDDWFTRGDYDVDHEKWMLENFEFIDEVIELD